MSHPQIQLHRCDECGLEVHLRVPVTRPCPGCGGTFELISEATFEDALASRRREIDSLAIERIVREGMPDIIEGFEKLLAEHSE